MQPALFWQNDVVAVDQFRPKEITSQDQEAGLCTVSQFPTQDVQMISGENASQFFTLPQDLRNSSAHTGGSLINSFTEEAQQSIAICKKAKFFKDDDQKSLLSSRVHLSDSTCNTNSTEDDNAKVNGESTHDIPDVAAAIEDLLEQTSKVKTPVIFRLYGQHSIYWLTNLCLVFLQDSRSEVTREKWV